MRSAHYGASISRKSLPKLQQATKIDAQKHEEAVAELTEKEQEVERLETALAEAQEQIVQLENLKDKEAVKALKRQTSGAEALKKEFDELIEAVGDAKPKASRTVLRHIIADYFDRAGRIDWFNDRQEFEDAVKYGLITPEVDHRVQWERDKLKRFKKAIQAVQNFLNSEEGGKVRELQDPDVPMDSDDLEFWEYHLNI